MGSRIFGSQSPNNSQYLINGESDHKYAIADNVEFNLLHGMCYQI